MKCDQRRVGVTRNGLLTSTVTRDGLIAAEKRMANA
jgi:hypothetical protein